MKKFIPVICLLLSACGKQYESIVQIAPIPDLHFSRDTLHIREKDYLNAGYRNKGKLTVFCSDVEHDLNLSIDAVSPLVHLLYRGTEILPGASLPVMDSIQVFLNADTAGLYVIDFYLRNRLGTTVRKKLFVEVSANAAPVASFFYEALPPIGLQSWPYDFNAYLSTEPDGVIVSYHYLINGQLLRTVEPVLHWVFHAKGTHDIGLFVMDDLGKNSDTIHQKITIP
jgi:hypothetical protein